MAMQLVFWLTIAGALCWPVCFWWMHRISSRQDALLEALRDQGKRIEHLSREEHDLIKDVHPAVGQIQEGVEDVKKAVKSREQDKR